MIEPMAADVTAEERQADQFLESRLRTLLPPQYQDTDETCNPCRWDRPA